MTQEEMAKYTEKRQLLQNQKEKIAKYEAQIQKLKDENEMLAAITKYLMKYRLNDNETNISFADIEKMIEIKTNVKVFENIGGEYFLKISLPKEVK